MRICRILGAAVLASLAVGPTAGACKLDISGPFARATVQPPSFRSDARVRAELWRFAELTACCPTHTNLFLVLEGVPPGTWGILVERRAGDLLELPGDPVELRDGEARIVRRESAIFWQSSINAVLDVSLVDATGRRSYPQRIHVTSPSAVRPVGMIALAVVLLLPLEVHRRRRRRRSTSRIPAAHIV